MSEAYSPSQLDAMTDQEKVVLREELWTEGRLVVLGARQLFIDVDVESDGVAGHGSMLSVGAQSPTGESFYSEVKPYSEDFLPGNRQFCEQHGLERERLLAEAPDARQVMAEFADWLESLKQAYGKKPVFTAFNAGFDWAHVDLCFVKAGHDENPFGIAPFDLKSLAMPLTGEWDWDETSKSKLPEIIVPPEDFTHHALEDAQWQQKIHFGMAALLVDTDFLSKHLQDSEQ